MRKLFLFLALPLGLFFAVGCEKIEELIRFDIDYTAKATIPGNSLGIDIFTPPVESQTEQKFEGKNTNLSLVKSITVKSIKVNITSPSGQTFNFVKNLKVSIKADGVDEAQIAETSTIPENSTSLTLNVNNSINLLPYLKQDSYTLKVKAEVNRSPGQDVKIDIVNVFTVQADIFN